MQNECSECGAESLYHSENCSQYLGAGFKEWVKQAMATPEEDGKFPACKHCNGGICRNMCVNT